MSMFSLFSVPVEGPSLSSVTRMVESGRRVWCVTLNPEMLLAARRDASYAGILRRADVRLVDGVGVQWALRFLGRRTERVTGGMLLEGLLALAERDGWRVALVGGEQGIAERAAERMHRCYPNVLFFAEAGGRVDERGEEDLSMAACRARIAAFHPQLLFAAFGHPKQERWIERHRAEFSQVKAIAGIGGALDVWAEKIRPAPSWMKAIGLEWLWRLLQEPKRWKRIVDAVFVFPWMIMLDRLQDE